MVGVIPTEFLEVTGAKATPTFESLPLIAASAIFTRRCGVSRAFLRMCIRILREPLKTGNSRLPVRIRPIRHDVDGVIFQSQAVEDRCMVAASGSFGRRRMLTGVAAVLACPALLHAQTDRPFRFGLTPVFLDNQWHLLEILREMILESTGAPVEFVQRRTYKEIVALLLIGEINAAWLCGYPLMQHADRLSPLALPVWRGAPRYQSYLIAARGRDVPGLEALRGDIHAYSDPDSNSGYLVTVSDLVAMGERPERFFMRSFFTYGHRNVVRAVARGLAQSGSVDGYVWEALAAIEPALVEATQVVRRSEWFGFPPIAVQTEALELPAIQRFADTLFGMPESALGREALAILQLDGFARPEAHSFDSIAARMRILEDRS